MRNRYFFYISLLVIPIIAFLLLGYSSGQTGMYSGSPGDGGNTCAVCHSGNANYNAAPTITTNIPTEGYIKDEVYSISVSVTSQAPGSPKRHGFQITAENASDDKVGQFIAGTTSQVGNSNHLVTHTYAGSNEMAWSFQWTAPSTNEGDITFYAAVNASNKDGTMSGDQIVTTTETVSINNLGRNEYETISFEIFPNPTTDFISLKASDYLLNDSPITIYNSLGQTVISGSYNVNNQQIDVSKLVNGLYSIQIKSGDKVGISKFIKQ